MRKQQEGMSLPDLPPSPAEAKSKIDPIEEMVGGLIDPIIVFPSGWEDTMPEWMRRDLPLHRLVHISQCSEGKAKWEEACDLEALIYLYPASLAFPLNEKWARIYLYLGTKCMGEKMPEAIRQESLSSYDENALRDLKRWIYKKKVEARKGRQRREKAEERAEVKPAKCEQLKFF